MVGLISVLTIAAIIQYRRSRNRPGNSYGRVTLIIVAVVAAVIIPILATLHLDTKYYPDKVEYRFASVFSRLLGSEYDTISLDSVAHTNIITYDPSDYGGWGMKGNEHTVAYNASGNKGILFTFKRGKQLMLGTDQPDSLYHHLKSYYPF